jgi:hypothetical protein
MGNLLVLALSLVFFVWLHHRLMVELVAAKHQLRVYKRQGRKPEIKDRDRLLWAILSRVWKGWRKSIVIVQPATVLRWQKRRVRDWWRRKSRRGPGRPPILKEHIELIKRMAMNDATIGEDTIALELEKKFGIKHSPTTIAKYMRQARQEGGGGRNSQKWSTFLKNRSFRDLDLRFLCGAHHRIASDLTRDERIKEYKTSQIRIQHSRCR